MYVTTIPRDKLPWSYNNWRGISEDLKTFRGILFKFKTKETANQIKVKYHEQPLRSQSKKNQNWQSRDWYQFWILLVDRMAQVF